MSRSQLECRIIIRHRKDLKTEIGMYDPLNNRYERLGVHGPDPRDVDRMIEGLKSSILRAGHLLTFSERSE